MKVVYIAGKFRGATSWEVEQNIRAAEEVSYHVWMSGAAALCPHTNTRFFDGEGTDELWLEGTMELMRRCDAVMLVQNWKGSAGARAEYDEAERLGLPIFLTFVDLDKWLVRNRD